MNNNSRYIFTSILATLLTVSSNTLAQPSIGFSFDQAAVAEFERFNNIGSETTTGESSVTILSVVGVIYF
jgi:hypothetical protein